MSPLSPLAENYLDQMSRFRDRLKRKRKKYGQTQFEVAEACRFERKTISRAERSQTPMFAVGFERLIVYLNANPAWLYFGSDLALTDDFPERESVYGSPEWVTAAEKEIFLSTKSFPSRLKAVRTELGLPQRVVAENCGLSLRRYEYMENRTLMESFPALIAPISALLEVNPAWLLFGDQFAKK